MKIRVTTPLMNYDGKAHQTPKEDNSGKLRDVLLRDVLCTALTSSPKDEQLLGVEKVRRFSLAQRVYSEDEIEFSAEDIVLCKTLIDKAYPTAVVAPAWMLLDPVQNPARKAAKNQV